jgi:hypothetical protein
MRAVYLLPAERLEMSIRDIALLRSRRRDLLDTDDPRAP